MGNSINIKLSPSSINIQYDEKTATFEKIEFLAKYRKCSIATGHISMWKKSYSYTVTIGERTYSMSYVPYIIRIRFLNKLVPDYKKLLIATYKVCEVISEHYNK